MNTAEPDSAQPNVVRDSQGAFHMAPGGYKSPYDQDWRVLFGLTLTFLYLIMMGAYIAGEVGWASFTHLPVERMGSFLEGAFAPLAFLWLVIGYFLQKKELRQNTEAMKMQFVEIQKSAEQAVLQSQVISQTELHQRRESFLMIAQAVRAQLGQISGMLYMSSQMADNNEHKVPRERFAELWTTAGSVDPEIYSREMMSLLVTSSDAYRFKIFFGTEIRTRHTEHFECTFERMLESARDCDENGMIEDAMMGNGHGALYTRMQRIRDNVPEGFTIGVYDFDPDSREGDLPTY